MIFNKTSVPKNNFLYFFHRFIFLRSDYCFLTILKTESIIGVIFVPHVFFSPDYFF